jgi:hypothetical protein
MNGALHRQQRADPGDGLLRFGHACRCGAATKSSGPTATRTRSTSSSSRSSTARSISAARATTCRTRRWATWRTTTASRRRATRWWRAASLGSPVNGKAAFNNLPFQYGVVERTFSEYKAGLLSRRSCRATPRCRPTSRRARSRRRSIRGGQGRQLRGRHPALLLLPDLPRARRRHRAGCNKSGTPTARTCRCTT